MEHEHLRGVARGGRQRRRAAFQRRNARLKHRLRRVHDARVDVAESLQAEQRRGVLHIVEHIGGRLIDRGDARARRWVGLSPGMDGKRIEAWGVCVGHGRLLVLRIQNPFDERMQSDWTA